jgi:competence protein ComFC
MFNYLLDFIFPKHCVNCGKGGVYFCSICTSAIKQGELICSFCARPSLGGFTHPKCKRRYGLDGFWSLGLYKDPLRRAIQKLKYRWITDLSENLTDITLEYWAKNSPIILDQVKKSRGENWIVVPVPLHPSRQNWRGFNQSALLAKSFARKLGLEYSESLKRIKNTKPQVKLKADERKANIKNAFSLATNHSLHTTNVLLIDDVWTTGSTLKECCYVLKRNGVKSVWALTLAR